MNGEGVASLSTDASENGKGPEDGFREVFLI